MNHFPDVHGYANKLQISTDSFPIYKNNPTCINNKPLSQKEFLNMLLHQSINKKQTERSSKQSINTKQSKRRRSKRLKIAQKVEIIEITEL